MPYFVRPMRKEDITQVNEIDREAFYSQWPPPNYQRELQNQLARYVVACDETKMVEEPAAKPDPLSRLISRIRQWFQPDRLPAKEIPAPKQAYIVGFAGLWVMADEAHLTNIAVRKSHQRHGIGELLLIAAIDLAQELKGKFMTLEVRASNATAQSLYTKYGFAQVGIRHGYYLDNKEDALIMSTESLTSGSFQAHLGQLKQAHSRKWGMESHQLARNHPAQPDKR